MTIESLSLAALGLAFVAGVISFLSPCVLPLLPVYLSYVSGVSVDRLERERWAVTRAALAFIGGFTIVFVLLGVGAGGIGALLLHHRRELTILAGAFFAVSGILLVAAIHLPLRAGMPSWVRGAGGIPAAVLAGAAVSIAWTPCIGPVLGSILTLAGTENAAAGALLLFVYSLGLGLPLMAAALAFGWVGRRLAGVKRHYRAVQIVTGTLLVAIGVLFISGAFTSLARQLPGFHLFDL